MERSNPVKELADALNDVDPPGRERRRERLANALQACLNEAGELGAQKAAEKMEPRFQAIDKRFDDVDASLRQIWRHMKGDGRLPIDN